MSWRSLGSLCRTQQLHYIAWLQLQTRLTSRQTPVTLAAGPVAPASGPQGIHSPACAQHPERPCQLMQEATARPLYCSGSWHVCSTRRNHLRGLCLDCMPGQCCAVVHDKFGQRLPVVVVDVMLTCSHLVGRRRVTHRHSIVQLADLLLAQRKVVHACKLVEAVLSRA